MEVMMRKVEAGFEMSKAYLFCSLNKLSLALFFVMVESVVSSSGGINSIVLVVYEHLIAIIVLALLAFFLEKSKRPPITLKILFYAFLLGLLQVTLSHMLWTISLQFISSTAQSIALNLIPSMTFVLALVFHQEKLIFWSINGQAKIWGLGISLGGALALVLWKGPDVGVKAIKFDAISDVVFGWTLIVVGLLANSSSSVLMKHVITMYPAEISLTALMVILGTLQAALISVFVVSSSSWKLHYNDAYVLLTLLLGGIVITGLSSYVTTWAIHTRGPVFTNSFNPLLVVFSFLLETFVLRASTHLGSIIGAVLVTVGLYLILWAKSNDMEQKETCINKDSMDVPLIQP